MDGGTWAQPWRLTVCRSRRGGGPRQGGEAASGESGSQTEVLWKPGEKSIYVRKEHEFHSVRSKKRTET